MSSNQLEAFRSEWNRALLGLSSAQHTQLVAELEASSRQRGFLNYPGQGTPPLPHPIALTPLLFPRELLPDAHRLARIVARMQSALPDRWLAAAHELRSIFPLNPRTAQWMRQYHRPRSAPDDLFIRLDVGIRSDPDSGKSSLVLFENNSLALAGVYNHTVGAELLQEHVAPLVSGRGTIPKLSPSPNLIDLASTWIKRRRAMLPAREATRGLFILDDPKFLDTGSEFHLLRHAFSRRGIPAMHGTLGDLTLEHSSVRAHSMPVGLVWRDLAYQEIDLPERHEQAAGFFALLDERRMLHGFGSEFVEKGLLECLTNPDYRTWVSAEEWRFLQQVVPWTRVLWNRKTTDPNGAIVDLGAYVRENRRRLIMKPNRDFGGRGVLIGPEAQPSQWDAAIERAMHEPSRWVTQTYVDMPSEEMLFLQNGRLASAACFATIGLFYAHDALGLHARIGVNRVVNVATGGALACVFLTG